MKITLILIVHSALSIFGVVRSCELTVQVIPCWITFNCYPAAPTYPQQPAYRVRVEDQRVGGFNQPQAISNENPVQTVNSVMIISATLFAINMLV